MPNANSVESFGGNFIATNFPYLSGTTAGYNAFYSVASEDDVYINAPSAGAMTGTAIGHKIVGAMAAIPTGGAYALEIAPANVAGTLGWSCAICIDDAPNSPAIVIGATAVSGAASSQSLQFRGRPASDPGTYYFSSLVQDQFAFLNYNVNSAGGHLWNIGVTERMKLDNTGLTVTTTGSQWGLATVQSGSGVYASTSDFFYNKFVITDNLDPNTGMARDPATKGVAIDIRKNTTGVVDVGGLEGLYVFARLDNPTATDNRNRNYVAGRFDIASVTNDGGASTTLSAGAILGDPTITLTSAAGFVSGDTIYIVLDSGNYHKTTCALAGTTCTLGVAMPSAAAGGKAVYDARGGFFAINPFANMPAAATNILNVTGGEFNTSLPAGATALKKAGLDIVQSPTDAVSGTFIDTGIGFSNQAGAIGWDNLISLHYFNGAFPLKTTGSILKIITTNGSTPTIANGFDVSGATISGDVLKWASGSITGGGLVRANTGAVGTPSLSFSTDTDTGFYGNTANAIGIALGGAAGGSFATSGSSFQGAGGTPYVLQASHTAACSTAILTSLRLNANNGSGTLKNYGVINAVSDDCTNATEDSHIDIAVLVAGTSTTSLSLGNGSADFAGYQQMTEMTAPAAPAANKVRVYAEDNGAGKTRLMAIFPTGAAQQIAIEP